MTRTRSTLPDLHDDDTPPDWSAATGRAARDCEWRNTTSEAIARIDDALTVITARVGAIDDDHARGHVTGVLTAALAALDNLIDSSPTAVTDAPGADPY